MGLADEIEAGFPPGVPLPADLRRLCEYAEDAGQPVSGYHDLQPAGEKLRAWFDGDAAANQFAAFGAGHNGSVLALWQHTGPDPAAAPVVSLGPHPLHYSLLAADCRAFLHLLGAGYGELGFDDLALPPEEQWLAPDPPQRLRAWLRAEFGITPPATGMEIVREARSRHPDFGAWVRQWQRGVYPEPPAERYRRQLRDVMVAGIQFKRVFELLSEAPTEAPALRRDLIRVAEHVSETDLRVRIPAEGDARAAAEAVADDILGCVERGERDRLRPTVWGNRTRYAWWYEMGWLARAWWCLWSFTRDGPPRPRTPRASR